MKRKEKSVTPEAVCDQQHFSVFSSANLLDDVEVFLDLQVSQTLCCQLHQLIDQVAINKAQLNHLYPQKQGMFIKRRCGHIITRLS